MRSTVLCMALATASSMAVAVDATRVARSPVLRDVEGFAIASCLASQSTAYLKRQGDAWASAIIQRGKGDVEVLGALQAVVERELSTYPMDVAPNESEPGTTMTLELMYCGEIVDRPAVRRAIGRAVSKLKPAYRR